MPIGSFNSRVVDDPVLQSPVVELTYDDPADPSRNLQIGVAPSLGSNMVQLRVGDREVFQCNRESLREGGWTGCFVLWPLPNRYDLDGQKAFEFEGSTVSLDDIVRLPADYFLIHGLVDDQPWDFEEPVVTGDSASVTTRITVDPSSPLFEHFPWESSLSLTFTLRPDRAEVTYAAENRTDRNMPHVFALHPYYELFGGAARSRVRIPAERVMVANEQKVPTGETRPVGGTHFDLRTPRPMAGLSVDDVWTDLQPGEDTYIEYDDPALRIRHVVTPDFTHAVLFTEVAEQEHFVCLEPQTGSTNSINLDTRAKREGDADLEKAAHLIVVPGGGTQRGTVSFVIEHL